jgi:hypothetical protein
MQQIKIGHLRVQNRPFRPKPASPRKLDRVKGAVGETPPLPFGEEQSSKGPIGETEWKEAAN